MKPAETHVFTQNGPTSPCVVFLAFFETANQLNSRFFFVTNQNSPIVCNINDISYSADQCAECEIITEFEAYTWC